MEVFLLGLTQSQVKSGLRNCSVMSYLALFFLVCSIFGLGFIAWTYTKSGEKWLKELLYYELFGIVLFSLLYCRWKFFSLVIYKTRREMA